MSTTSHVHVWMQKRGRAPRFKALNRYDAIDSPVKRCLMVGQGTSQVALPPPNTAYCCCFGSLQCYLQSFSVHFLTQIHHILDKDFG